LRYTACSPPKYIAPQITRLNALFTRYDLTATRTVLLKRISRGLGGTQSLSKNGRETDRVAFVSLVRELVELIGEMSLIDNQPRMASVCAVEDAQLVCIAQDNLQNRLGVLAENDQVLHLLLKTLVRRLRGLARNTE